MVTPEALNERKAALEGDPGTDSSTKVTIPAEHSPMPIKHTDHDAEVSGIFLHFKVVRTPLLSPLTPP